MKAFICGLTTLALLICAVFANTVFISKKTDIMIDRITSLPDSTDNADLSPLLFEWDSIRALISLTVHRENVDDIDDTLEQLELSVALGHELSYRSYKTKLLCTTKRLKKTESFSLSRIF